MIRISVLSRMSIIDSVYQQLKDLADDNTHTAGPRRVSISSLQLYITVAFQTACGLLYNADVLLDMHCCEQVLTLKMDLRYWPTWELQLDPTTCKWARHNISSLEL